MESKVLYEIGVEVILFCIIGISIWIIFVIWLIREQKNFRKRRRGLANFHEESTDDEDDEEDDLSAKYMISFFTGSGLHVHKQPPSSPVTVHLLGSLYPGKFHQLKAKTPEESARLFPPFGAEKFLVTEDVSLGRIIGIILQNEVSGHNPFWDCSTVIVRDVKTNEAWCFKVNSEISFPPRLILPATRKELCTFKFSFSRRFRREIRNGQFGYFSFLFRSKSSVYSYLQRCVTSIGLYLLFFVSCFLFLDFVFSPGHSNSNPGKAHPWLNPNPVRPSHENPNLEVIYGESSASYWLMHVVVPSLIAALITSFMGFVIISCFREASKYEKHYTEMDYVIGTALLEEIHFDEKLKRNREALIPPTPEEKSLTSLQVERSMSDNIQFPDEEEEEAHYGSQPKLYFPVPDRKTSSPRENKLAKRFYGFLKDVKRRTLVLMKLRKDSQGPSEVQNTNKLFVGSNVVDGIPVIVLDPVPNRSEIFEPGGHTPPRLEIELSPHHLRSIMRNHFVGTIDDVAEGYFRRGSGAVRNFRITSQSNLTKIHVQGHATKKIPIDLAVHKDTRKWYRPITAWAVVIIAIALSISFITIVAMKGKFHKRTSEDKFFLTFCPTLVSGILIGTFILEPIKIIIIALVHAARDKKLHKKIQSKNRQKLVDEY